MSKTILTPEDFSRVLSFEREGNASFVASEWTKAEESYTNAIAIFESRTCVTYAGAERETLVELLTNLSMVYIEKQAFVDAEAFATKSLYLHPGHEKASYQRALVRLEISQRKPKGDAQRIGWAIEDVKKCKQGTAKTKLEQQLKDEASRIEKHERKQIFMGFGTNNSGDHDNTSAMMGRKSVCRTNEAGYVA